MTRAGDLPPIFRPLAGANLAAQAAEQISLAAVPIVAVLAFDAGAREVGLLAAAQSLPFLLLAPPLGLWADRASRRRMMVSTEALRVVAMALLAALLMLGPGAGLSITALAVLGFVGAVGTVAFSVAAPAMIPTLVPRAAWAQANGRLEMARSLAFAAGPALAGAVVAATGGGTAFALAALLSAAAVLLLRKLPDEAQPLSASLVSGAQPRRSPLADLREGAGFVWHDRWLRPVMLTAVVWHLSWMVLQAAYVPHAMQNLGLGAGGVGLTLSLYGAGMVLGALAAPRLMAQQPHAFGQRLQRTHAAVHLRGLRVSTFFRQAQGSCPLKLADCSRLITTAVRSPVSSLPTNNQLIRSCSLVHERMSWLFSWTEVSAKHLGIVQGLIATCRLQGVDPYTYLIDVLQRVGRHPAARVTELTPRRWRALCADIPLRFDLHRSVRYGKNSGCFALTARERRSLRPFRQRSLPSGPGRSAAVRQSC